MSVVPLLPQSVALPQRDPSVAFRDLADWYMAAYTGRDSSRVQRVAWWVGEIGHLTLADLDGDPDPIAAALRQLARQHGRYYGGADANGHPIMRAKSKPLANSTINRYSASVAAVLAWADREGIAPKKWTNPMRKVYARTEDNKIVRYLDDDERTALLTACKKSEFDRLYLLVLMGITCGARRGELLGLRWSDLDLTEGTATLHTSKNKEPRVLPLLPNVVDELRRFEGEPSALVFGSHRNPGRPYAFVTSWHAALKVAGVKRFRFHDLRHTCASYLAMDGATLAEVADVLGHKNLNTTRRYAHLSTEHKRKLAHRVLGKIK